jgi:hypothetical protein
MIQVESFSSMIDFGGSSTIGLTCTTIFFGILRFLPITKDRKQDHKIKTT